MNKLQNVIRELAEAYEVGGLKTTRFSITVSERDNLKLEEISDKLQISKQDLVNRLLTASLHDLDKALSNIAIDDAMRKVMNNLDRESREAEAEEDGVKPSLSQWLGD